MEKVDIKPGELQLGQMVVRNTAHFEPKTQEQAEFNKTVMFLVVYTNTVDKRYGVCNFMTDCMCLFVADSLDDLATWMNSDEFGYTLSNKLSDVF